MQLKMRYVFTLIVCFLVVAPVLVAPVAWADVPGELYIEAAPGLSIFINDEYQGQTADGSSNGDKGMRLILLEGEYTLRAELVGKVIYEHTFYLDSGNTTVIRISH